MRPILVTLAFVTISAAIPVSGGEPAFEKDLKQLQGLWRLREIRVHAVGEKNPGEAFSQNKWHWSIKGNKLTWIDHKDKEETITLSARGKAKFIDLTNTPLRGAGNPPPVLKIEKLYGTYELEQNVLKICLPITQTGANLRPVQISGDEGSGCMVWVFERIEKLK